MTPPKLPCKDLWELVRRYVLHIDDAHRRGYLLQLMIEQRKNREGER